MPQNCEEMPPCRAERRSPRNRAGRQAGEFLVPTSQLSFLLWFILSTFVVGLQLPHQVIRSAFLD